MSGFPFGNCAKVFLSGKQCGCWRGHGHKFCHWHRKNKAKHKKARAP